MRGHRGFTLIELLVLVTVIGVLAAVAMPNFSATIKGDRDTTYVNALASGLALTRSEAIKHGNATICAGTSTACNGNNWSDGWVVFTTSADGTVTLVRSFPATYGATVKSGGGNLFAFNNAGMSFTSDSFTTPAASEFAVCDARGATFGRSLQLLPSGSAVAGTRIGYKVDGTTALVCAPNAAMPGGGGGALGIPALFLLAGLCALVIARKRGIVGRSSFRAHQEPMGTRGKPMDTGPQAITPALRQTGFSLLEVLIALVILSVGLLGIAGLLSTTLKSNDSAYMRTVATVQAYNIIDRMRANISAVNSLGYVHTMPATPATSSSPACTGSGAGCDAGQLAAYDIAQWEYQLAQNLPQGRGSITTTITPTATTYTVTVVWNDSRANEALQGTASANTSSLSVTSG